MTDARLPSRWLLNPNIEALSDRAWRVFTAMLMWSNEQSTDGVVPRRSLRLLHPEPVPDSVLAELAVAGLVDLRSDTVNVLDWADTQSTAAQVKQAREKNRDKNRVYRKRQKAAEQAGESTEARPPSEPPRPDHVTGHAPSVVTGHVTGHDLGQDRQGQEGQDRLSALDQEQSEDALEARATSQKVDLAKVRDRLTEQAGESVSNETAFAVMQLVIRRARAPQQRVGDRTGLILTAIRNDWHEISQLVFGADAAISA